MVTLLIIFRYFPSKHNTANVFKSFVQFSESYKLTNQNEACGLEEPFVVPVRVDLLQQIAHPVVFPQPDGGVHHQTGDQAERLVAHGEAVRVRNVRRVVHFSAHFLHCRRVHLSVQDLQSYAREGSGR